MFIFLIRKYKSVGKKINIMQDHDIYKYIIIMKFIKLFEDFNSNKNFSIKTNLNEEEYSLASDLCAKELHKNLQHVPYKYIFHDIKDKGNPNLSLMAIDDDDNILGAAICYESKIKNDIILFKKRDPSFKVEYFENIDEFDNLTGIEIHAISVKQEFRSNKIGSKLLESINTNYDYVFLKQDSSLKKNIDYTNKGYKLICSLFLNNSKSQCDIYAKKF